jgi:hypothetical protein
MCRFAATLVFTVLVSVGAVAHAQSASGAGSRPQPQVIPGQFIVELHPGHSQDAVIQGHGLTPGQRWDIVNGFVAHMSDVAASRLRADGRVKLVAPDVVITAFPRPPSGGGGKGGKGGGGVPTTCPSPSTAMSVLPVTPTGVARIGAASLPVGDVSTINVAIIDTGIDDCHPDLHVNPGINIIDSTKSPRDDNGHGTHVAGIVGAIKNDFGVVGVAPGASLYPVKVLDASGGGSLSNVVTALNWAVGHSMKVANLSLGALDFACSVFSICGQGTECSAISNAVAAGVTVVVAAGNSADDALYYTPANCRDSLTVSAFADSDGASGGHGPTLTVNNQAEIDDTFAQSFSNHSQFFWDMNGNGIVDPVDHPVVDLMAPGVAIRSTMPTYTVTLNTQYGIPLNYGDLTGTSMAAPHVSGAAVRYLVAHPAATAEEVRRGLVAAGECHDGETPSLICSSKWPDDPDPDPSEPLLRILGF